MPRYPIDRATNFIVEDESWQVIEYDHTSVPGTIYLSLTENKINLIYDDTINNIADTDKLAQYVLAMPEERQVFNIEEEINPTFTIMKNGKIYIDDGGYTLLPDNDRLCRIVDGKLVAKRAGEATIYVQLNNYPDIKIPMVITISEETQNFDAYIEGPDFIRLGFKAAYCLKDISGQKLSNEVEFYLENNTDGRFASINEIKDGDCIIEANKDNVLTKVEEPIVLVARYNGQEYRKNISIVPIW